jgi:hypothetical protein
MPQFSSMIAVAGVLAVLALAGCAAPDTSLSPGEAALIRASSMPRNGYGGGWGYLPRL